MTKFKEQKRLVALFFAVMFFDATSAFAQNSIQSEVWEVTQQQDFQYTQKVITEDPQTTISFTQHQATGEYEFYRTIMGNPNIQSVLLNSSYKVNDMFLLTIGNLQFLLFCGVFNGNVGFIAKANLATFFTNPPQFDMDVISTSISIDKIKAYLDANNQPQIVAIGTNQNNKSFFLHFDNASSLYEIYYNPNTNEVIDDIELTTKFVVTTGRKYLGSSDIIVRRYDKPNTSVMYEEAFSLTEPTNSPILCQTIVSDLIAVFGTAYYTPTNLSETICFAIDMSSTPMNVVNSQWISGYNNNAIDIRDVDFDSIDKHLIIVEQTPSLNYPNNNYAVIAWNITNAAPNVDIYYGLLNNDNYVLNSITALDPNKNLFASVGIYPKSNEWLIWYGYRNTTNGNCNKQVIEPTQTYQLNPSYPYMIQPQIQTTIKWVTYQGTLSKYSAKIICQ